MNKINKSVSDLIKSITDEKILVENVIIPTMESRIYKEIKKSTFFIEINNEKYALCSVTLMFTCLPYIVRKINKINTKILSPLSLKILYLYNIAYNPQDAIRNRCMLKYLENLEKNFYKNNKEVSRLDINLKIIKEICLVKHFGDVKMMIIMFLQIQFYIKLQTWLLIK